jgi:hypothetical protein
MNNPNKTEKNELIDLALQESVSGGLAFNCEINCHIFSINVCHVDLCGTPTVSAR